jgi:hypothetical protein
MTVHSDLAFLCKIAPAHTLPAATLAFFGLAEVTILLVFAYSIS